MRTADIAKRYLDYFAKHDHLVMPSASLISPNPTTLFTIAGMVPFIPYLLGEQTPPKRRMTSNQKCVRTLDIDEVGKTTRHGTFFQMLGNFSIGDYFKEEAIHYAWELLTTPQDQGGYGFDPEKLWVTTFTDDEEARSIWKNEGFDPEHMQIFGMEDNFWTTVGPAMRVPLYAHGVREPLHTPASPRGRCLQDDFIRGLQLMADKTKPFGSSEKGHPKFFPDRKSTRLNSSHSRASRMPSSA